MRLLAVQQRVRVGHIAFVGRRRVQAVHQARVGVRADVGLHAERPLVALLRLVHLGVAGVGFVLGRGRRADDGGVHHRALAQQQAALGQVGVDALEQLLGELVRFEQAAELEQRGGVGHGLAGEVNADELAERLAVVDGVFHGFVSQAEPELQAVHAQHPGHADGRAAHTPGRRVLGLNDGDQARPGHDLLHLPKKPLAPRHSLLLRELEAREAALHRRFEGKLVGLGAGFHGETARRNRA